MGGIRRFYGWENFNFGSSAKGLLSDRLDLINHALVEAFRPDYSETRAVTLGSITLMQPVGANYDPYIASIPVGWTYGLRIMKTSGSSATEGALQFSPEAKDTGITRIGCRLTRAGNSRAPVVYAAGTLKSTNETETYSSYSFGNNSLKEVYVEVEINWDEKMFRIYLNDTLSQALRFSRFSFIFIGSFVRPAYVRTAPSPSQGGETASWGWPVNSTNSWQTVGDIYCSYWDGEGEDWGRYGPIYCKKLTGIELKAGGTLLDLTADKDFLGKANTFDPYKNTGVLTAGVNAETVVDFAAPEPSTLNGELIGYSFSVGATQYDATQPLTIDSNIYIGDTTIPNNPKVPASGLLNGQTTTLTPNISSKFIPAEDVKDARTISVGVKLNRTQ